MTDVARTEDEVSQTDLNLGGKWCELTQLEEAYYALCTQPREAQIRMLRWLADRLADDDRKAVLRQQNATRARIGAPLLKVLP